jgi:signal peptidase I
MNKKSKIKKTELKKSKSKFVESLKWIDPFNYVDILLAKLFGEPDQTWKKVLFWIIYLLFAFVFAFLLYKIFGLIFGVSMPFATVVSGSMEPSFYRGDIIIIKSPTNLKSEVAVIDENIANQDIKDFAKMYYEPNSYGLYQIDRIVIDNQTYSLNDIVSKNNSVIIYPSNTRGIPIIHRVALTIEANDGTFYITKGDNNKTNRIIDEDCNIDENGIPQNGCLHMYPIANKEIIGKKIGRIPYLGYIKLFLFG